MKQFCFDERWYKVSWLLPCHALSWLADSCWGSWAPRAQQRNKLRNFSLHSEKIQLFAWTDDITVVLRVHWLWWVSRQTPSVPAAILFDVTKPRLQTAEPTQSLQCVYFLLPTSCFLLPASFNARLMFLKGSCSGNIQHGRREEKKTSRLVSLMEHHQCCSSPTLSASFSS